MEGDPASCWLYVMESMSGWRGISTPACVEAVTKRCAGTSMLFCRGKVVFDIEMPAWNNHWSCLMCSAFKSIPSQYYDCDKTNPVVNALETEILGCNDSTSFELPCLKHCCFLIQNWSNPPWSCETNFLMFGTWTCDNVKFLLAQVCSDNIFIELCNFINIWSSFF